MGNNEAAERAIIGALIIEPDKINEINNLISSNSFLNRTNSLLYRIIVSLHSSNNPIDVVSIATELCTKGLMDQNDALKLLSDIVLSTPTSANAAYYAMLVYKNDISRQLEACGKEIQKIVKENMDLDSLLNIKEELLKKIEAIECRPFQRYEGKKLLEDTALKLKEEIEGLKDYRRESNLKWGIPKLDEMTMGIHNQEFTVIGARPGCGKTTLMLNIVLYLATRGIKCYLASLEMSAEQLIKRMATILSGVEGYKVRNPKSLSDSEKQKINESLDRLGNMPIIINDKIRFVQELYREVSAHANRGNINVLFIDYITLLETRNKKESRTTELDEISRLLKVISSRMNIPVIALAQLNRNCSREDRLPRLYDLKDSGEIEQDADNVFFLHIDSEEALKLQRKGPKTVVYKLIVSKQRNGPTGYIDVIFEADKFRFIEA